MDDIDCLFYGAPKEEVERANVFVHGFLGNHNPRKGLLRGGGTWAGFENLILEHDDFADEDSFFVGYPSVMHDTNLNAIKLLQLLRQRLVDRPESRTEPYQRLRFLAHSEGGVVVRKAILRALRDDPEAENDVNRLIRDAEVVLFAPAQGGHRIDGPAGAALDAVGAIPWVGGVASAVKLLHPATYSRAYQDMSSSSLGLTSLMSATESPELEGESRKARTLWAESDRTVEAVDYSCDHPSLILRDSGHTDVSKPKGKRRDAIVAFVQDRAADHADAFWGLP